MCDVNVITGDVYHSSRDLYLPGPIPFVLERSYDSSALNHSAVGWGWRLSTDMTVNCTPDSTRLTWGDGTPIHLPALAIGGQLHDDSTGLTLDREAAALRVIASDLSAMHLVQGGAAGHYVLAGLSDQFGNTVVFDRDEAGLVRSVTDSCGRNLGFVYDDVGYLRQIWLVRPVRILIAQFKQSAEGDLVAVTDRTEKPFSYSYDHHVLVSYTNRTGGSVYYQFDRDRKCERTWRSDGWIRMMNRDPQTRRVKVTDSRGHQTIIVHNENGNLISVEDAQGVLSENVYDANGQLIFSSGPPGTGVESQVFDSRTGTLISTRGAEQLTAQYDERGFPTRLVDEQGLVSEYVYENGLLRHHKSAGGAIWQFAYDHRGELRTLSMPNGRIIERVMSADWQTETLSDNFGVMEVRSYDELGRIVLSEDAEGHQTRYQYGERDDYVLAVLPDGNVVRNEYDPESNLVREINELGFVTEHTYTRFGHLTATSRAYGWRLEREYDTEDNMVSVTTPAGAVARMEYDARGQLITLRSVDGRETRYSYDEKRRLVSSLELPSGNGIEYSYGNGSEVLRAAFSDGGFTEFEYSADGSIVSLSNETCTIAFEWDPDGYLLREQRADGGIGYTYDTLGNVASVSSSWETALTYNWDLRGRLASASLGPAQTYQFEYDGRDLVTTCVWPNGFSEHLLYDALERLVEIRLNDESGAQIHGIRYTYDPADRLVRESRSSGVTVEYVYDALDRVTQVFRNGSRVETYDYDLDGNVLTLRDGTPVSVEEGGRIHLGSTARAVSYDSGGRIAAQTSNGRTFHYRYNVQGQLTAVEDERGGLTEFSYDALGRRVRKASPSGAYDYLWTSVAPHVERSTEGTVTYMFLPGSFFLKTADRGGSLSFVLDHLGSPTVTVGESGERFETERSLWGELMASSPARNDISHVGRLGQYWDGDVQLYYAWHRYYDPFLARYLQPDPLDLSGGLNLYAYSEQPLMWVDPFGLYVCRIKMNECWNEDQEKDAAKKLNALNEARRQNPNRRKPGRCTFQTAEERWEYCKAQGRLTKDQLKDKRRFRTPCKIQHIDHVLEKQLRGGDDCENLQALNAKVNMSFGAQILRCRKRAGKGAGGHYLMPSSFQFYKTKTIPCKPGEEC